MAADLVLDATFEAIIFDWDGTAVPDRRTDATRVRQGVEALCTAGVHVFVVSGTHVGNVDGQLQARPPGPGRLFLCLNQGSEVFAVDRRGPAPGWRRTATPEEASGLDRAAAAAVEALRARGVAARIVSERLNRRKIDLIPTPEWTDPPKARIGELLAAVRAMLASQGIADLAEVVEITGAASRQAGLAGARITTDVKHVEIGLTDKSDSARWAAAWLATRGITGALVLVGGDEFGAMGGVPGSDSLMLVPELARASAVSVGGEPGGAPTEVVHVGGGPERFCEIIEHQLGRRATRRVPGFDPDPAWVLELPSAPARQRAAEALGSLANGWAGLRAQREEEAGSGIAPFAVSGIYTEGESPTLVPGPVWTGLELEAPDADRRWLDLRTAVLVRRAGQLRSLRFVSGADPHAMCFRAEGSPAGIAVGGSPRAPDAAVPTDSRDNKGARALRTRAPGGGSIAVATADRTVSGTEVTTVERLAAWAAAPSGRASWADTQYRLAALERVGFDEALAAHREAWARRWAGAEVSIEGAPADELAARFAVFHLLSAGPDRGEAAVGARGLTGPAYGGHVFWDADVFVLPALAAVAPEVARAMLQYRLARLPAARQAAAAVGLRGARFPWESAGEGTDVTPRRGTGPDGQPVAIRTGDHEEHITADVAWAATEYAAWTGDEAFLSGPGAPLLLDTARYWASRARRPGDGRAHIYGVIGPDEYHEVVDDSAFTNLMARWNLRAASELARRVAGADSAERRGWRRLAANLVDGYDPDSGVYEQFAGYFGLEPLLVAQIGRPPLAADVVLGRERLERTQVIKQADVLMAHHLIPGELAGGSLTANLAFYEPRTAHGSSLSPAIHAALLARDRKPEAALELFRMAARLDLDDLTGTTAGGLHMATFGGLWQALAYGFAGLRPRAGGALQVQPSLPAAWESLTLGLHFRGFPLKIRVRHDSFRIDCTEPLTIVLQGRPHRVSPPGRSFDLSRRQP